MMKVYCVITERDGRTIKEPGVVETKRFREEFRFAASRIEEVWETSKWLREDEERDFIGIYEEHPALTICGKPDAAKEQG